jgi:hypothetical protein
VEGNARKIIFMAISESRHVLWIGMPENGTCPTMYSENFLCGKFNKVRGTVCGGCRKDLYARISIPIHSAWLNSFMFRISQTFVNFFIHLKGNL